MPGDEQVAGLQVAVQHAVLLHVADAAQQLVHEVLEVRVGEVLVRLDDAVQVRVQEVHHDVDLVLLLAHVQVPQRDDLVVGRGRQAGPRARAALRRATHVAVAAEVAHEADFAQGVLGVDGRLGHGRDLLDGHLLAGLLVPRGADDAVRTAAQGPDERIIRVAVE